MNDLPKRKQIRLKDYDYSQNGYYFITICAKDKQPLFWDNKMMNDFCRGGYYPPENQEFDVCLSEYGKVVKNAIQAIPIYYMNAKIDEYVIMPDHIHLILMLSNEDKCGRLITAPTKSVATIIGQMKRWVSKKIGISVWQKSYYEHIIRNETDYLQTLEYIINNPLKRELTEN